MGLPYPTTNKVQIDNCLGAFCNFTVSVSLISVENCRKVFLGILLGIL